MDVVLTATLAFTQLVLGGMGVWVSLKPPDKKYHLYWIGGFVAIGLTGVLLTAWLAKRSGDAQQVAARDTHNALVAATSPNTAEREQRCLCRSKRSSKRTR